MKEVVEKGTCASKEKYLQYVSGIGWTAVMTMFYAIFLLHPILFVCTATVSHFIIIENILFSNNNHFNFEPVSNIIMINNIIIYVCV